MCGPATRRNSQASALGLTPQPRLFQSCLQGEPWARKGAPNHGDLCVIDNYLWGLLSSVAWLSALRPSESGQASSSSTDRGPWARTVSPVPSSSALWGRPQKPYSIHVGWRMRVERGSSALKTPDRATLPASVSLPAPILAS